MAKRIFGAYGLVGGTAGDLDNITIAEFSMVTEDKAIVIIDDDNHLVFTYDGAATNANDIVNHPFKIRPKDYVDAGVWIEDLTISDSKNFSLCVGTQ